MSGMAEPMAEHTAEGGKKPPEDEEKHPATELDKKAIEGGGTHINPEVKEQQLEEAEKAHLSVVADQLHLPGSGTNINFAKEQITFFASTLDGPEPQRLGGTEKTQMHVNTEDPASEDASKKLKLKKKKRKRSDPEQIKKEQHLGGAEKIQVVVDEEQPASEACCQWRWRATYSARLYERETTLYKGSIVLDPEVNRVVLLDIDEIVLDALYLKEGDLICPGSVFDFSCHKVEIGERIVESREDPHLPTIVDEGRAELLGDADERGVVNEKQPPSKRTKKDKSDEKKRERLKRKRLHENCERKRKKMPVRSPQVQLVRSSIGTFARVASLRNEMSPQAQWRKSDSPSTPNVTVHFPSPSLPRAEADFAGSRPRKLKSQIWKDFIPIYQHGKVAEGKCKHCNEVFPASKTSGTNHIHRHLKKCLTRRNMHEMVEKMRASTSSPQVSVLDNWSFSQKVSRRELANMIVQHGLPFSIVEYSGFKKFVKSLNPMFRMVSRTTIREDCVDSYKEQRAMLREMFKNCGARVSLTADMWTSNQRLGYLCITCHFIDKTWQMQKRILRFCMMETPHNGFQMYNVMLKSLQYWNIEDKICSITLDNASVNGSMMDYLKDNF